MKRIPEPTSLPRRSMARISRALCGALLAVVCAPALCAAPAPRWVIEAGPSLWLNTEIEYVASVPADPAATARADRVYDDGFNRVDASGNVGDGPGGPLASRTGYFGFSSDSQVDLRNGTLSLHQLSAAEGAYVASRRPERRPGVMISARYAVGELGAARRAWGFEAGLDYAKLKRTSEGSEPASLRLLTDVYQLGGVVPQRAPYAGRFSPLPGDQRIGDVPSRSISAVAGTATGQRSFNAETWAVRLGAWVELLPARPEVAAGERNRWSLLAHGGPMLLSARGNLMIDERLQTASGPAGVRVTERGSRRRQFIGGFAGLKVRRALGGRTALVVSGDFVHGPRLSVAAGARRARLDLSNTFLFSAAFELGWGR